MSAYSRGELSIEAYLVRLLAALCRQNNGEVRIKGELIDTIGEPTTLVKSWDTGAQELVLRVGVGSFVEVFRVNPEKQAQRESVAAPRQAPAVRDPLARIFKDETPKPVNGETAEFLPKGSTLDDERLVGLERQRAVTRAAALIKDELRRRRESRGEL